MPGYRSLGDELVAVGRRLARDVDPHAVIDRDEDHCPASDLFLPSREALRVQELNETIAREAQELLDQERSQR